MPRPTKGWPKAFFLFIVDIVKRALNLGIRPYRIEVPDFYFSVRKHIHCQRKVFLKSFIHKLRRMLLQIKLPPAV